MKFSRQEYWSVSPCPPPGAFPNPGIEPGSPALQANSLLSEPQVLNLNFDWRKPNLEVPGGPVFKTSPSGAGGTGSIPGQEDPTYLLAKRPKHNHNCNKINKKALKEKRKPELLHSP